MNDEGSARFVLAFVLCFLLGSLPSSAQTRDTVAARAFGETGRRHAEIDVNRVSASFPRVSKTFPRVSKKPPNRVPRTRSSAPGNLGTSGILALDIPALSSRAFWIPAMRSPSHGSPEHQEVVSRSPPPASPRPLRLVIGTSATGGVAAFRSEQSGPDGGADLRLLRLVYHTRSPVLSGAMFGFDRSAWPVFSGVPALVFAVSAAREQEQFDPFVLISLSEVVSIASIVAVKHLVRRPRPLATHEDIVWRGSAGGPGLDSFSFPSGHAAIAFSIATALTMEYRRGLIVGPAYVWATGVALSRLWLGAHYPTDAVVGAAVGVLSALVVGSVAGL